MVVSFDNELAAIIVSLVVTGGLIGLGVFLAENTEAPRFFAIAIPVGVLAFIAFNYHLVRHADWEAQQAKSYLRDHDQIKRGGAYCVQAGPYGLDEEVSGGLTEGGTQTRGMIVCRINRPTDQSSYKRGSLLVFTGSPRP